MSTYKGKIRLQNGDILYPETSADKVQNLSITSTVGSESITVGNNTLNVVTRDTAQNITGLKKFDTTPQTYVSGGKNLFTHSFSIFTNTGGIGSVYTYFKLPDDGKNYTLSVRLKDSTKSFGSDNVFGWTVNGGNFDNLGGWLVQGDTIKAEKHVFYANDAGRCISMYAKTEAVFNKLLDRYYIQLEEGTEMTSYEEPGQIAPGYYDVVNTSQLPTKTSDLTNDSGYITLSDVPQEIFVCTYGTTTYNEITTALNAGKLVSCFNSSTSRFYPYTYKASNNNYYFTCSEGNNSSLYMVYINSSNVWSSSFTNLERTSNKVTTINSNSTNTQYPSAKCVYDNIEDVREVAEGKKQTYVVNITNNPTLNSENDSINLLSPLVLLDDSEVSFNNFQIGDTIYIQDLNVPDRWVSDFLNKIEIANGTEGNSTQSSESYPTPTNPIPVISSIYYNADYQPVELRGISTAKDIYNNGVITRKIGFIDLGTVHWTYTGIGQHTPYGVFSTVEIPNILSIQLNVSGTFIAKCNKYRVSSSITSFPSLAAINNSVFRACNGGYTGLKVNIVDGSKTGNDLVNGIASWLSGTYLYYELYEPTTENTRLYNIGETVGMVLSKLETVKPNIASISVNGTNVAPINENVDITVPTATSDLINDSGYVVSSSLATVATTGSYTDLSNKPTIPTVNDATLTITQNSISIGTFTANASTNATIDIVTPKVMRYI